ncbi:MAG: hypothetical protein WCT53_02150 [Candidatus Gracilibacteria bacterium]
MDNNHLEQGNTSGIAARLADAMEAGRVPALLEGLDDNGACTLYDLWEHLEATQGLSGVQPAADFDYRLNEIPGYTAIRERLLSALPAESESSFCERIKGSLDETVRQALKSAKEDGVEKLIKSPPDLYDGDLNVSIPFDPPAEFKEAWGKYPRLAHFYGLESGPIIDSATLGELIKAYEKNFLQHAHQVEAGQFVSNRLIGTYNAITYMVTASLLESDGSTRPIICEARICVASDEAESNKLRLFEVQGFSETMAGHIPVSPNVKIVKNGDAFSLQVKLPLRRHIHELGHQNVEGYCEEDPHFRLGEAAKEVCPFALDQDGHPVVKETADGSGIYVPIPLTIDQRLLLQKKS